MQLQFEEPILLSSEGSSHNLVHYPDNKVYDFYIGDDGKTYQRYADVPEGEWASLSWSTPELLSGVRTGTALRITYSPDVRTYFLFTTGNSSHKIAMIPNTDPMYQTDSPYRLYYGVDTQKGYMNIADYWEFVFTLRHGEMYELDEDQHTQYYNQERHITAHDAIAVDAIRLKQLAAPPGTPTAGEVKIYALNDGDIYVIDSSGVSKKLT